MQILVNEPEYCKLEVDFESDPEIIVTKTNEVLNSFKNAPVPGFRRGKATPQAITAKYRVQIDAAVKRALAEDAFHSTLFEKGVKPLSQPTFTLMVLRGNKFNCSFSFYKKPDFELKQYKDFEIPKPKAQNLENLVQATLEDLRRKTGDAIPFTDDDQVMLHDSVIIDYDCFINDEKDEKLSAVGELFTIGKSKIKFFDEQLIGMKNGESRTFALNEDVGEFIPELTGKKVSFTATIRMGSKITPCTLDDELARRLDFKSYDDLVKAVINNSARVIQNGEEIQTLNQLTSRLLTNHVFKVPDKLVLAEAQYIAISQKIDWDRADDATKENLLTTAEHNVRLHLILDRVREEEPETQLTDEDVIKTIKANLKYDGDIEKAISELAKNGFLPVLMERVRDQYALDFLKTKCILVE